MFKRLGVGTLVCFVFGCSAAAQTPRRPLQGLSQRASDVVAWCIVPFDAAKRGPVERAQMLEDLGIRRCAYDWRAKHVPAFEAEILEYKRRGIELFAFWEGHEAAYQLFRKHDVHPQIWRTLEDPGPGPQQQRVSRSVASLLPLVRRTAELDCKVGLYNHGGWGGKPENLVAVCKELREQGYGHVGIVYNFHHGHDVMADWPAALRRMKPYLFCLNLNGMNARAEPKILGISKGKYELEMIREVIVSGYDGPLGILDHRDALDARDSLRENLAGLQWILRELENPGAGGPKPAEPSPYKVDSSAE